MSDEGTPLGISGYLSRDRVEDLIIELSAAWATIFGVPPADLEGDLTLAKRWFDPVASGKRLRREIAALGALPSSLTNLKPPLMIHVGPEKWLVTPEGRCALDLLQRLPVDRSGYVVTDAEVAAYERRLAALYREWSRHRLDSVIALLAGTDKPLQIPAAGTVVALMVNRSTAKERALRRFADDPERRVVDEAFFGSVQAFVTALAPERPQSELSAQLRSGWMLFEVRRRVGDRMVFIDARNERDGAVWIKEKSIDDVIDIVSRDLVRGNRSRATPEQFAEAYDSLVDRLRQASPALAGFGLAHERPRNTQKLRERLTRRISHHLADKA